jgi:iron complex outermembrane receptor protein
MARADRNLAPSPARTPSRPKAPRQRRSALAGAVGHALWVMALGGPPALFSQAAQAQTQAETEAQQTARAFNIPAGPLTAALKRFGLDAAILLSFSTDLTHGVQSKGINGNYTPAAALRALLADTGLAAVKQGNGGYLLMKRAEPAAAAVASPDAEAALPVVRVTASAERETATGPVVGFVATRSATATKTDTAILATPQSITVIGADQIETLGAQSITDAIAYSVGALRAPYMERTGDVVVLRGFSINSSYRDGTRYQANRFDGQQEPYGLERIEVLKGAASILYGAAEPGGVLNTVSKRPTTEALRELKLDVGSFSRKQLSGDLAGALSADGDWSYRLTGVLRESGTAIDHVPDDRTYLAPALKWQPNASTSLTLLSEFQRDRTAYGGDGLPTVGTVLPNPHGQIPRQRFVGEPGYDRYDIERYSMGYLLEHAFSDHLKLRHSLRNYRMDQAWSSVYIALDLDTDQRTSLGRGGEDRQEKNSVLGSDTSLQYDWQAAGIAHKSLIGIDYSQSKVATGRFDRTAGPLDLFAPVYGGRLGEPTPSYGWRSNTRQLGIYAQDQLTIADQWVLLLGGRHDAVRQTQCGYFDPSNCAVDNEQSSALTGRAGLVYLAGNGLAPFASISQSFEPANGLDSSGGRFKPTRGEQLEVGLRYQPASADLMLSAALYQLTQTHVLVDDPLHSGFQIQQGEARSRGLELEARGRVARNLQLIAAYTYTDARTTQASPLNPEAAGKRSSGVPYDQFSLWSDYTLGAFGLPELRLGAGMRYVGETTSPWHDVRAPAYTVLDAMASYATGPWKLALNISNLGDKTYIASCPYRCFYGEPRKAIGSVTYRW